MNNTVQENVNASRVVKAYVREDHEIEKFHGISQYVYKLFTKAEKIVAWNNPVMMFFMYSVIILMVLIGGKSIVGGVMATEYVYKLFTKAEKIVAWNNPVMMFFMYSVIILMVLIGGKSIVGGVMATGELTSVLVYAMQILMSLNMVTFVFVMIMIAEASTDRILEVLEEVPEMTDAEDAVKEVADGDIRFENVSFSYAGEDGTLSLKDVNLHIKSGQTIGIFGGTGSAKSTLVQLIPRLYDVTKGSVKVGGIDVRKYNLEALRNQVSMVLQKNVLFTGTIYDNIRWGDENASDEEVQRVCRLAQADSFVRNQVSMVLQKNVLFTGTIYDNIRWGDENASDEEVQRVCRLAQADSFVREFPEGYETMIAQGGNNVSGGQKQRLCIARALLKKPKILILDDSTSAVDTKTDAMIRKAFREEIPNTTKIIIAQRISSIEDADKILILDDSTSAVDTKTDAMIRKAFREEIPNTTKIIIAQRISSIEDADMIIVMDNGEINGIGTSKELLENNAIYREVYESQVNGGEDNE